jgi:hypothetical protein
MPWILERHFRAARNAFTIRKLANAFLALVEMRRGLAAVRSSPVVLRIEPCNVCNLKCPLCACGRGSDPRRKGFMTVEDFSWMLDQVNRSAVIARLDGLGEPTLHPGIFDMVRLAKSRNVSVVMHSNFNTPACENPAPFIESGLDRLVISIDGATQETHSRYRVGGSLEKVCRRVEQLVRTRRELRSTSPLIEIQTVDFPFNRGGQTAIRKLAISLGADRYQVTEADRTTKSARINPRRPRRCPWLWTVVTVGWDLDYRACTNAWSYPWPRFNAREIPVSEMWNSHVMQEARRFNVNKGSREIMDDVGCKCSRCYEMLVAPLQGDYANE